MIKAGIYGATGYAGAELALILERHPEVSTTFATSVSYAGQTLDSHFPQVPALPLCLPEEAPLADVDVVFLGLPHAAAAATAVRALDAGVRVIDLSADFRFNEVATYETWYRTTHPAPELLTEAVYGLTEAARAQLPGARLVATPGCYPTAALLALRPLLCAGLATQPIIIDAKSGVSGAGRSPKLNTQFVEVADNFAPYAVGRAHRHLPEMEQVARWWDPHAPTLIFTPHLLPVPRGILSTVYVPLPSPRYSEEKLRALYEEMYGAEPFVKLLPAGSLASLGHVTHTNRCVISLSVTTGMLIVTSAIDNLVKGAAGQAVQNMNVVFGCAETAGLL